MSLLPGCKNFMALVCARPDCLVSSSGADYKAWSGAGQNCNVFVRSAASQQLASRKFWLKKNFWNQKVSRRNICKRKIIVSGRVINVSKNLLLTYEFFESYEKNVCSPHINFVVMKCWTAPDLSQTRISRIVGLDIARSGPDQTINYHEIFPHGIPPPRYFYEILFNIKQNQKRDMYSFYTFSYIYVEHDEKVNKIKVLDIFGIYWWKKITIFQQISRTDDKNFRKAVVLQHNSFLLLLICNFFYWFH